MQSKKQESTSSSIFGCMVACTERSPFNGLRRANSGFLRAIIRYSRFKEIHIFAPDHLITDLQSEWEDFLKHYGTDKSIKFLPAHQLSIYFSQTNYQVFHQGDPWIGSIAALRNAYCSELFPITGRAHTLSTDSNLTMTRDLIFSPLQRCDAILCSSNAQEKVMMRLLSAASSSISNFTGMAIPYKGSIFKLPLGIEPSEYITSNKEDSRTYLGLNDNSFIILTLGRISTSDKMDLYPTLLVINDLIEGYNHRNICWIIAGAGDATNPSIQSLLKQAYDLNLENCIRFELGIDDERKNKLLSACDIMLSLSDNIQESFGIVPLEAMINSKPVILSDWNGYSELIEDKVSGFLIESIAADLDDIIRPVGTLLNGYAHLLQSQGTAVNVSQCAKRINQLINNPQLIIDMGEEGKNQIFQYFQWELVVNQFHQIVDQLNYEAAQTSNVNKSKVGLPYHQVFEHYPSKQLTNEQTLKTTDRGVRTLLKSENIFYHQKMTSYLKIDLIDQIAQHCLTGCTVEKLKNQFAKESMLTLHIFWMHKYQLLADDTEHHLNQLERHQKWWPAQDKLATAIIMNLKCTEPHRFKLIEPILCWLDTQLTGYHQQQENIKLRSSLLKPFAKKLDEQLLQAIGWIGHTKDNQKYSDILDYIIQQGGLSFLTDEFPLWYRLNRLWLIRSLRNTKKLFLRFKRDLNDINQLFSDSWQNPARYINELHLPFSLSGSMIAIITCDNGEKLVYKNRHLTIEHQIIGQTKDDSNIAGKINKWLDKEPGLATIKIFCGSNNKPYGFCQFVKHNTHEKLNEQQVTNYYQQLGVIAGLSILIGLGDIHNRNVISNNGIPYLIDVKSAFCSGVIKALESEFNNPQQGFSNSNISFLETSFTTILDHFHCSYHKDCIFQLVNGEVQEASTIETEMVLNNWIRTDDNHSLSNTKPYLCSQYANSLEKGLMSIFRVVVNNQSEWCQLLESLKGIPVCYQQRFNQTFFYQQQKNLRTFIGFQKFSKLRLKRYFTRTMNRLCQEAEVIQKWDEPEWFEPITQLSDKMTVAMLSGSVISLKRVLGEAKLCSEQQNINTKQTISDHYFSIDTLSKSIEITEQMAKNPIKMQLFMTFLTAVIKQWVQEKITPGKDFPEAFINKLPD